MNILVLEDDFTLSTEIRSFLLSHDYTCDCIYDGGLLLKQFKLNSYDLVILDINVPGMNGLEVARLLRDNDQQVPILMLTAFGEIEDKITAYNSGADDYLVKPFHFDELLIRIKSLLRRKGIPQNDHDTCRVEDLVIDFTGMQVHRSGKEIALTKKEFKLLSILAKANGRVLSKNHIAETLWDYHIETNINTIEVYINFLRKKIDKGFDTALIHTKVGYGYYLSAARK